MSRLFGIIVGVLAIAAGSFSGPLGGGPALAVGVAPLEVASNEASRPAIATPDIDQTGAPSEASAAPRSITATVPTPWHPIRAIVTAPSSPTNATTLLFGVTFAAGFTGLDPADFSIGGTAPGCIVGEPIDSAGFSVVPVTGCGQGTVDLTLGANSILDVGGASGPARDASSRGVAIDRTPPVINRIYLSADAVPAGTTVTVTATAEDDSGVASAQGRLADESWATLTAIDGALGGFNEEFTGVFDAPGAAGTYAICVRATDVAGNSSDGAACVPLTVTTTSAPPVRAQSAT